MIVVTTSRHGDVVAMVLLETLSVRLAGSDERQAWR